MNDVVNAVQTLNGLPSVLLVAMLCLMAGYLLRLWPNFPNAGIPLVCVVVGGVLNPILAGATPTDMAAHVFYIRGAIIGLAIGFITWMFHDSVLSTLESKIPFLGTLLNQPAPAAPPTTGSEPNPNYVPPAPAPTQSATTKLPLILLFGALALGVVGCTGTLQKAKKTTYGLATAADGAMKGWGITYKALTNDPGYFHLTLSDVEQIHQEVNAASRKVGGSLAVVNTFLVVYATNSTVKPMLDSALLAAATDVPNLVSLIGQINSKTNVVH